MANIRELTVNIKIGGRPGCSDPALLEFAVPRDTGQVKSKVRPLSFRKGNFQLLRKTINRNLSGLGFLFAHDSGSGSSGSFPL